jgi:hypothetical protein
MVKLVKSEAKMPRCRAQHPPRCQRRPEEAGQGQSHLGRRRAPWPDDMQKLTDKFIADIDKMVARRKRVLTV